MKKICVGVTGLDVFDNPMPGLGIAKCLKLSKNIKVLGISYNPFSPGCYSRDIFDEVHVINNPLQKERKIFEDIVRLKVKNGLQVVIPSIPWEIPIYAELKNMFKWKKINILLPRKDNVVSTLDPEIAYFASSAQFQMPSNIFIHDKRGLAGKLSALRFPITINNSRKSHLAYNTAEAEVFAHSLFGEADDELRIQEYINGEEYSVAALANENHKIAGIVVVKKLVLTDQGGTPWIVVSVLDKELIAFTEGLIKHLKWIGPLELRFIKEAWAGINFLVEFQPCFPSWIYLTPEVGQNLPLTAMKLALGKNIRYNTKYKAGSMYVRNAEDITCDVQTLFTLMSSGRLIYNG